jgi:hypothetical protein
VGTPARATSPNPHTHSREHGSDDGEAITQAQSALREGDATTELESATDDGNDSPNDC